MDSLKSKYGAQSTSTSTPVNTQPVNNTMKVVSAKLILNITMTEGLIPDSAFAKAQSRKGVIINTRSVGAIRYNTANDSVYADFIPLPEKPTDKFGANNCAVVVLTYEDGTSKTLSVPETVEFWNTVLKTDDARQVDFFVKINMPFDLDRDLVEAAIREGDARAVVISFNDMNNMFTFMEDSYRENLRLSPANCEVSLQSNTVDIDRETLGVNLTSKSFTSPSAVVSSLNIGHYAKKSKSSKKREARKANSQVAAAKAGVETKIAMDFGGAPVATVVEPIVETAPVVESVEVATAVVDQEKVELRRENAELKAKVANLETKLDDQSAILMKMMAKIDALASAPAPAAAPVVEEVKEEVVAKEPVVDAEPEVKEVSRTQSEFLRRLAAQKARNKARKDAEAAKPSSDDDDLFNMDDM